MIKFMLDTNMVIYAMKRKPESVYRKFSEHEGRLCISSITYAELHFGVEYSSNPVKNRRVLEDFTSQLPIQSYDEAAAEHYGTIKAHLTKNGKPIGDNDMHIAAHARSAALIVVTNNGKHFERVPGLIVENWV